MTANPIIREATPADAASIREVTIVAFGRSEFGHNGEADLIATLTDAAPDHISLVATISQQVVGHILLTPAVIRGEHPDQHGMGLAPMSVLPAHQRQRIGRALVVTALQTAFDGGCRFVAVLGHPEYYQKFGFEPAGIGDVTHGFADIPQDVFFLGKNPADKAKIRPGKLFYHDAFGEQHVAT